MGVSSKEVSSVEPFLAVVDIFTNVVVEKMQKILDLVVAVERAKHVATTKHHYYVNLEVP